MNTPISEQALNPRARHLLKVLVEQYIRDGNPVGSRTLARGSGLDLSPATIRNVMADLEDMGLLASPHTSAGRIPTSLGYRVFVDSLLTVHAPDSQEVARLNSGIGARRSPSGLTTEVSSLLSDLTHLAGLVMVPKRRPVAVRQLEFLKLSDNQVLAILISDDGEVENRIIATGRQYSAAELEQAANYLNEICAGRDLRQMRKVLLKDMQDTRKHLNGVMVAAIRMAERAFFSGSESDDLVVSGQTNLMEYGDLLDMSQLREIFEAFNCKQDILYLLDHAMMARGVQLFIGEESGHSILDGCSVVTSPYEVDGEVLGVLGVIGPTRMDYERVIPIVDLTAKLYGVALKQPH